MEISPRSDEKKQVEDLIRCKPTTKIAHRVSWSAWLVTFPQLGHHVFRGRSVIQRGSLDGNPARFDSHRNITTSEKWWSSSMGFGWHPIYEMEKTMFETTKQNISSMILMKLTAAYALRWNLELKPWFTSKKSWICSMKTKSSKWVWVKIRYPNNSMVNTKLD